MIDWILTQSDQRRRANGAGVSILVLSLAISPLLIAGSSKAIIGGTTTSQYDWMVAFVSNGSDPIEERIICSGALIKPGWVLTAAHCLLPSATTTVIIGRQDLSVTSQGQTRTIADQERPIEWEQGGPDAWRYDVMLVELNSPSTLDDMNLANSSDVNQWGEGTNTRIYGYGVYDNDNWVGSKESRRAEFPIRYFAADHLRTIAWYTGRAGCGGDSGGPGIVSVNSVPKHAGVFVRSAGTTYYSEPGGTQELTKTGYRGTSSNSPIFDWIQTII